MALQRIAEHDLSSEIAAEVHEALKDPSTRVWSMGCIEDARGIKAKGEAAIIEQEEK